jgi:uroporphyrinogen III methyltransferase/synthase
MTGKIYLVGAGPGDPGLITLRAIHILQKADVVLYDFLAHPSFLAYCPPHCIKICVGKRKGFHVKTQAKINHLLKKYASKYSHIVRLKGGDPLIFGRGGEEVLFLKKHHISYEIVPGVSSATAIPALTGLPLTHRKVSRSVAFVTASTADPNEPIPIPEADTLVFFMGMTKLSQLVDALLKQKRWTKKTPIALIYKGSFAAQKTCLGTLGSICEDVKTFPYSTPTLIVVGKSCQYMNDFEWQSQKPLFGRRVVLLRQSHQALRWHERLLEWGAESVIFPLIQTTPLPARTLNLNRFKSVTDIIFTSSNAVDIFMEKLLGLGRDARSLQGKTLTVIGKKTASALLKWGLKADATAEDSVAEGVLELFSSTTLKKRHMLLPQAKAARTVLKQGLEALGAKVTTLPLYETKPINPDYFPIENGDDIIFTSSSTATHFFTHPLYAKQNINAYCLGEITAGTVRHYQTKNVYVAEKATWENIETLLLERH